MSEDRFDDVEEDRFALLNRLGVQFLRAISGRGLEITGLPLRLVLADLRAFVVLSVVLLLVGEWLLLGLVGLFFSWQLVELH